MTNFFTVNENLEVAHNKQLVPTPGIARHVSYCVRGRRGTAAR
jgi:hypothetical protein